MLSILFSIVAILPEVRDAVIASPLLSFSDLSTIKLIDGAERLPQIFNLQSSIFNLNPAPPDQAHLSVTVF
jgi:hypothetical protein